MMTILSSRNIIFHFVLTLIIGCSMLIYNALRFDLHFVPALLVVCSFILYYDLTNFYDRKFAIINIILNFAMLQCELLVLYIPNEYNMYSGLILSLLLIATNKILVDLLFLKFGQIPKTKLRITCIIERYKETGQFKYR